MLVVSAPDGAGNVLGSHKVLGGADDHGAPGDCARTGITVTTDVLPDFLDQDQELGSAGLRSSKPVNNFRFTVHREPEGGGAVRFNVPDLEVPPARAGRRTALNSSPALAAFALRRPMRD